MNRHDLNDTRLFWKLSARPGGIHSRSPFGPIPLGLCQCGCGAPTPLAKQTNKGLTKGLPIHYLHGHQMRRRTEYTVVDRGYSTPCWEWTGHRHHTNYGMCRRDGIFWAHRWYYIQYKGPIPPKLVVDHLCNNPPCVNPEHLEAKTNAANVRRGRSHLNIETIRAIRNDPLGCVRAARKYKVSKSTIIHVRSGRRWGDVE